MTLLAFVLTIIVWLPNGSIEGLKLQTFTSESGCLTAGALFESETKAGENSEPPMLRNTYHWDCRRVIAGPKVGA